LGIDEAMRLGNLSLRADHVLLGLIRVDEGAISEFFKSIGLGLERGRKNVVEISQIEAQTRYLDSLDILRDYLSDPGNNPLKKEYIQKSLRNLVDDILPPPEQK
jgi:hypothetical protein